jgi:S-(hydroxymethyl)glutathione dehydrogenase/alcohol dehydrogenase
MLRPPADPNVVDESLYLDGKTARRMSLGFNGLAADWYWMRSLQYVGRKIINHPEDMPLDIAALIGCGVLTGVGAATNTASIRQGDTVAVIGCGGVGLNVIQGAVIAGATRVIAVDMLDNKLKMAEQFGATDLVNAGEVDAVAKVMELTGGRGADVAFEVIGLKSTIDQTINMTRRGGEAILVGVPKMEVLLEVPAFFSVVFWAKTIKGCWYGSSNVQEDVPKLIGWYREGKLKLDELISRRIDLDEVNDAFRAMEAGEVARSVIQYG